MEDEKLKELQGRIVNLELERKQLKEQLAYLEDAFKNVTLMDNAKSHMIQALWFVDQMVKPPLG